MGLFSKKPPRTWLGRYVAHVGAWGILAAFFGIAFTLMLAGDIRNFVMLSSTEATVTASREECTLEWKTEGKRREKLAESCETAEAIKAKSTKRLYRIDRDTFATVQWTDSDGRTYEGELDKYDTKSLDRPEAGETVTIRARGGDNPKAVAGKDAQSVMVLLGMIAFCAWMAWPPSNSKKERRPFVYIRQKQSKGRAGRAASGLRGFFARWCVNGVIVGIIACLFGVWVVMNSDERAYWAGEARVAAVHESCRLVPDNGKLMNVEALQELPCDQAYAIAENRPEENYNINERFDYDLRYIDTAGVEREASLSTRRIRKLAPAAGDIVAVEVDANDPTRIRIEREVSSAGDKVSILDLLLMGGPVLAIVCALLAWLLGVGIDLSRFSGSRRRAA